MASTITQRENISLSPSPIIIEAPKYLTEEDLKDKGPTKEELEKQIDVMKKNFEKWKEKAENDFKLWREQEIDKVENEAFDIVKKSIDEFDAKINEAQVKCQYLIFEKQKDADKIKSSAMSKIDKIKEDASKIGYNKGKGEGQEEGRIWSEAVVKKLNTMLSSIAQERLKLIFESKKQLSEIIVVIAREVVKSLVETQPKVVYDNIMSILKQLKGRAEVIIKVNGEDLADATKHKREFLQTVEGIERIKIVEDNTVDKGGCIIDTEYGRVDSKITTQVKNIEKLIKEYLKEPATFLLDKEEVKYSKMGK